MKYQNKFTEETTYSIDYSDLNEIIRKEYSCPNFECALDQSNDSTISISIDGNFDKFDQKRFEKFLQNKKQEYDTTQLLLQDMCRKEFIKSGLYLIYICW